jgi:hypothetical protein
MARTYARVKTSIWADDAFRCLSMEAQHLYFVLLTSASLSYCGVADWRPARIAAGADMWEPSDVERAAWLLHELLFIVVDDNTEEVLIRSFIRNDGLMEQPNVATAMVRDYAKVASRHLRGVVVHELVRLHEENPSLKGWGNASVLLSNPSVNPSENPSGWGPLNPSGNPSNGVNRSLPVTHAPLLTPNSVLPNPSPQASSPTERRASRKRHIPDSWQPNEKHIALAAQLELDLAAEVEKARDNDKAKGPLWKDHDAGFNNWLRNAAKWGTSTRNPYNRQQETDQLFNAAMQRAEARERQELP